MTSLAKLLEAALFASARPIATEELAVLDPEASKAAIQSALDEIREHYDVEGHGVELVEIGGGWQILTRAEYTEAIERAQLASRPAVPAASHHAASALPACQSGCRCVAANARSQRLRRRPQRNRQLVSARQLFQMPQRELFEEQRRRAVQQRTTETLGPTHDVDQRALLQ